MSATAIFGLASILLIVLAFIMAARALPRRRPSLSCVCAKDKRLMPVNMPEGLLTAGDARYVQRLGNPKLLTRFRAHRRAVFSLYLTELTAEFDRLTTELKLHVTEANVDRPDLLFWLMRESARFHTAVAVQRCSLALHWAGLEADLRAPQLALERLRGVMPALEA